MFLYLPPYADVLSVYLKHIGPVIPGINNLVTSTVIIAFAANTNITPLPTW